MIPKIVLDTNVLVTALKSSKGASFRLLSMAQDDFFALQVSTTLVAEYEAVLKRGLLALSEQQVDDVLDYLCARAAHHKIYYLWRPVLKDPGDDFLLELAVKAQARIVTWNVADFKRAQPLGVLVQTPKEFLNYLEGKPL
jgi:putative PIN family toxin of toxin-antitoxin system